MDNHEDIIGVQDIFRSQDPSEAIKKTARGPHLRNAAKGRLTTQKQDRKFHPSILQINSRENH